jgi:NTP pyrophosphatase (non-canonical NTP hydrolase)
MAAIEQDKTTQTRLINFKDYCDFVDKTTSFPTKHTREFVDRVVELEEQGNNVSRLLTAGVGINAEAGEFLEIIKKALFQGKPLNKDTTDHMMRELGDIMWYVAQACMALEITLEEVIVLNMLKLADRYPEGQFSVQRSENRKEGDL